MKHLKTWLIEKEWDNPKAGFIYSGTHDMSKIKEIEEAIKMSNETWIVHNLKDFPVDIKPNRLKKIAFGYTNLERAKKDVEELNRECANCPRRAALHTKYTVVPNPIHVRIVTADDTYKEKMSGK